MLTIEKCNSFTSLLHFSAIARLKKKERNDDVACVLFLPIHEALNGTCII
jgi:hypothetical protein